MSGGYRSQNCGKIQGVQSGNKQLYRQIFGKIVVQGLESFAEWCYTEIS